MLTDAQVRGAEPAASPPKLFDERGLYLHVMPNGGKYWFFNFRFKGKHKTLALTPIAGLGPVVFSSERKQGSASFGSMPILTFSRL